MTLASDWKLWAPAGIWLLVLTIWLPWTGLGAAAIVLLTGLATRNWFAGICLAALTVPAGVWLIHHPGLLKVLLSAILSWPMIWVYRHRARQL